VRKEKISSRWDCDVFNADGYITAVMQAKTSEPIKEMSLVEYFGEGVGDEDEARGEGASNRADSDSSKSTPLFTEVASEDEQGGEGGGDVGPEGHIKTQKMADAKKVSTTIWVCKSFPISLNEFIPVLEVIGVQDTRIEKFRNFLESGKDAFADDGFPVKTTIPIMLGISASITIQQLTMNPPMEEGIFAVPGDYAVDRGYQPAVPADDGKDY